MSGQTNLTTFFAIYAALLSSFTFGWNIFRDLLDKAKLKVSARLGRLARNEVTGQYYAVNPDIPVHGASEQLFVFVDVTNVGRRPVRWDGWGGKHSKKEAGKDSFSVIPLALPKMLNEGDSHVEWTPELHGNMDNVREIFVWDASGKHWHLSNRHLKKLKEQVRKQLASGPNR
jgi:hypothetical protein